MIHWPQTCGNQQRVGAAVDISPSCRGDEELHCMPRYQLSRRHSWSYLAFGYGCMIKITVSRIKECPEHGSSMLCRNSDIQLPEYKSSHPHNSKLHSNRHETSNFITVGVITPIEQCLFHPHHYQFAVHNHQLNKTHEVKETLSNQLRDKK